MVGNNTGDFRPCKNQDKITFKFETKVIPVSVEKVPLNLFKFADFEEILSPSFDQQILVELNAFLQAGNISNVVVVLLLAKLRTFQGEIQLQNAFNCSKLLFNPDHPDVVCLRKSLAKNNETSNQTLSQITDLSCPSAEDEFLKLYPRTTISGLVDCKTYYQRTIFIVFGSIEEIVIPDDWSYKACKCNKSVKHNEGRFWYCENCNKHVANPTLRIHDSNFEGGDKLSVPQEICDIMHKQFLFKVEAKEDFGGRFESTYTVKKICKDADIIMKFIHNEASGSDISVTDLKSLTEGQTIHAECRHNLHERFANIITEGEYKLTAELNCTKVMFNPNIPQAVSYRERYKLLLNVADDTGSATFTVFDREGCYLMNKKGNEILEKMEKTGSMEHPRQ
ncbi:uncharacterized protein LOC130712543 [Lotus japonicus]|uniref:uncharacterized protein LOC130712543 n=1 Tax=Lotus japonicus TaxID=34305 RepID=UPI00258D55F0|nr:uncharacterized protein LOC130712543 [Lotus japonicus]